MSKRIRYTDEPLGRLRVIPDFLPDPEQLAQKYAEPAAKAAARGKRKAR